MSENVYNEEKLMSEGAAMVSKPQSLLDEQINCLVEGLSYYEDNISRLESVNRRLLPPEPEQGSDGNMDKQSEPQSVVEKLSRINHRLVQLNSRNSTALNKLSTAI